MARVGLSKSQFITGLQCKKALWYKKNNPELAGEISDFTQTIFDTGNIVGDAATKEFPGGVQIEGLDHSENIKRTTQLIEDGVKTIYEATFQFDDVLVMVDVLNFNEEQNAWDIYEVKSSTHVSPVYIKDASVQSYVLNGLGISLNQVYITTLNKKYTINNEESLFTHNDVTGKVNEFLYDNNIPEIIEDLKNVCGKGTSMPEIGIGAHCTKPYDCNFREQCWGHIPDNSVFKLSRMRIDKKMIMYNSGVIKLEDIPECLWGNLTDAQYKQVKAFKDGDVFLERENLAQLLESFTGNIGFLDFETFQNAIPVWENQHPYEQIPFQYSLHTKVGDLLHHDEFIGNPNNDSREEFIQHLINDCGNSDTILVYNISFERGVLQRLQTAYPEYFDDVQKIIDKLSDLMIPFSKKWYYTKEMKGRYSIKVILPALVPELSYDGMEISDGMVAMRSYTSLVNETDMDRVDKVKNDLLEYCWLDTYAMVKILERLEELVK